MTGAVCKSVLVSASLISLWWPAATARADPDQVSVASYLQTLDQAHVPYDNAGEMVDLGNTVCRQARGGTALDEVGQNVINNGFTPSQAGFIMGAAVGIFCPDMQSAMDSWSNS